MRFTIILLFFFAMLLVPPASAVCTTTCYVDDDGTGDYNVDHNDDAVQINQAITAVGNNATAGNRGTVILNYTATPYIINTAVVMNKNYVILRGENSGVVLKSSAGVPMTEWKYPTVRIMANYVEMRDFNTNGARTDYGYEGGAGKHAEFKLSGTAYHDISLINLTSTNTMDDMFFGNAKNVTIRNVSGSDLRHSLSMIVSGSENITIEDVYCTNLGNACIRFDSLNGGTVRNITAVSGVGTYTQFAIELVVGSSTNDYIRDLYIENVTHIVQSAGTSYNGIMMQVSPDAVFSSAWHIYNISVKNVLIDCNSSCATSTGDYIGGDRPGGVRVQSANNITFDGITTVRAPLGFRFVNYRSVTGDITIKNSIIVNNSQYGIQHISGGYNYIISYNDIWNNPSGAVSGLTLGADDVQNIYQNPLFASTTNYRLKSPFGRWDDSQWVTTDSVMSPAIDAGDLNSSFSKEPTGNGGRINLGFDGNTMYASKSSSSTGNYSISGYVFDNNNAILSGVVVSDGTNSSVSGADGLYNITALYNGTYNLSFSKQGFNTAYLEVTINGVSNSTANKTIYDTTAPFVTGLTATKVNNSAVRLDYGTNTSVDWYTIYRDGVLKTTTQSVSWTDIAISTGNTYQYNVSANDTYGNQGSNSTVSITVNSYTTLNLTPMIDKSIKGGEPYSDRDGITWLDIGDLGTVGVTFYGVYRILLKYDLSSLPANATITEATILTYYEGESAGRNKTTNVSIFRAGMDWNATSSWNSTSGGTWYDQDGVLNGSNGFSWRNFSLGDVSNNTFNVKSIIEGVVNGTWGDNGFLLKSLENNNDYYSFISKENSRSNLAPLLYINYTEASQSNQSTFMPPAPTNLANTTIPPFSYNWTWQAGTGNVTDSYNVSSKCYSSVGALISDVWANGTTVNYRNGNCGSGAAHGWHNISVQSFNSSGTGTLNQTAISGQSMFPNNAPVMNGIGAKSANEGDWLNFSISGTDADSDSLTCGTTATKGTLSSCNFNWSVGYSDSGVYNWNFYLNDSYGGSDSELVTVTISEPNATTDDFDVYLNNVSVGSHITVPYYNATGLTPDTSYYISVRGHNHTHDTYSTWVNQSVTTDALGEIIYYEDDAEIIWIE